VVGVTLAIVLLEIWSTARRMEHVPNDERVAAIGWRTFYVLRLGMVMTPALAGSPIVFFGAGRGPYLAGVTIGELLLWVTAPSRRNLSQLTERYRAQGRDIDVTRASLALDHPSDASE